VSKGLRRHVCSDLFVKQYKCTIRKDIGLIREFDRRATFITSGIETGTASTVTFNLPDR
jgi:hypothetical protein